MPLQGRLSIEHMCQLVEVSRRGFYRSLRETGTGRGRDGSAVIDSTDRSGTSSSRVFHSDTGQELWKYTLPAGGQATPMTYTLNGKQYVVIAAGGHGKLGTKQGDYRRASKRFSLFSLQ
jgi:hypothetical protein